MNQSDDRTGGNESSQSQAGSLPPVAENLISAFVVTELAYEKPFKPKFADIRSKNGTAEGAEGPEREQNCWIPVHSRAAIEERPDEAIWVEKPAAIADDLFPYVDAAFSGRDDAFARRYTLSPMAKRLIQRADLYSKPKDDEERKAARDVRRSHELLLRLPALSRERLQARGVDCLGGAGDEGHDLRLRIVEVEATHFRTGLLIQLCKMSVSCIDQGRALTAWELQEAVASLGRSPRLFWQVAKGPGKGEILEGPSFGFRDMLLSLAPGDETRIRRSRRTFLHVYCRFDLPVDENAIHTFGQNIARSYTDDYRFIDTTEDVAWIRNFRNVGHCLTREGAATIVHPKYRERWDPARQKQGLPAYLESFRSNTLERNYLPVIMLCLHELAEGMRITRDSAVWPQSDKHLAQTIERLTDVTTRSLSLRLAYRFRQVSAISMHNAVNSGMRRMLGLDELESDLAQDAAEASAFLQAIHHRKQESRFRWATSLGSAALAALLVAGLGNQLERILSGKTEGVWGQWFGFDAFWIATGTLTALVFLATLVVAWNLSRAEKPSAGTVAARKLKLKNLN